MNVDRRTLFAVALCLIALFAYPMFLRLLGLEHYLKRAPAPIVAVDTTASDSSARATGTLPPPLGEVSARDEPPPPVLAELPFEPAQAELERSLAIETPLYRAEFSSRGARLVAVELKHYASAHGVSSVEGGSKRPKHGATVPAGDRVTVGGGPSFGLDLGSGAGLRPLDDLVYAVAESLDAAGDIRALTFTARDAGGLVIRQTYRARPGDYALDYQVELSGVPMEWRLSDYSLTTRSWPLLNETNPVEDANGLRATSLVGTNVHREGMGGLRKAPRRFDGNAQWAAVQTRYFMGAVAAVDASTKAVISRSELRRLTPDQLKRMPPATPVEQDVAVNTLVVGLPGETRPVQSFVLYFGPNEYFRLAGLGVKLERVVDLGWSWILPFSKALLQLLNWLDRLLHNYGVAIVVLATVVRVALHPLNMMSMKSMRAMHRLQPEMEKLKAKHKDNPQAMNTAVMGLYKENKVNPAGGCLPMLLQMPLFIALYSVLFNAIELRQAPFVGWIQDLSAPDVLFMAGPFPIRLLPILMAASGVLSQKLTPTDPRQVTTMYLMNVIMVVFFYNLPSGLVLYWTVMNLLTALQQWMLLREDGHGPIAAPAEVPQGRAVARKAAAK